MALFLTNIKIFIKKEIEKEKKRHLKLYTKNIYIYNYSLCPFPPMLYNCEQNNLKLGENNNTQIIIHTRDTHTHTQIHTLKHK